MSHRASCNNVLLAVSSMRCHARISRTSPQRHRLLCSFCLKKKMPQVLSDTITHERRARSVQGSFTHAIFDAVSDAISRTKHALPYPTRMLFSLIIAWIGIKGITYYLKAPFFPISANLAVFCRIVKRLKTRGGWAGAGFVCKIASKSHERSHV